MANPIFPKFSKLGIDHSKIITPFVQTFPCYSDFNFTSLYTWNLDEQTQFSWLNNNLVLQLKAYEANTTLCTFLGSQDIQKTAFTLLHTYAQLNLIPEVIAKHLSIDPRFEVLEEIQSHDYILDLSHLRDFPGHHYKDKRYGNRKGRELYSHVALQPVSVTNTSFMNNVNALLNRWVDSKQTKYEHSEQLGLSNLIQAINRISHLHTLPILALEFRLDKHFAGFMFTEDVGDSYVTGHYINGDTQFKFVYEMLYNEIGSYFTKSGFRYLNIEQDIGIDYLRKSKHKWHPNHVLKKYTVKLRPT